MDRSLKICLFLPGMNFKIIGKDGLIMNTGLFDKNGKSIMVGNKTRLVLPDGEERIFDV